MRSRGRSGVIGGHHGRRECDVDVIAVVVVVVVGRRSLFFVFVRISLSM